MSEPIIDSTQEGEKDEIQELGENREEMAEEKEIDFELGENRQEVAEDKVVQDLGLFEEGEELEDFEQQLVDQLEAEDIPRDDEEVVEKREKSKRKKRQPRKRKNTDEGSDEEEEGEGRGDRKKRKTKKNPKEREPEYDEEGNIIPVVLTKEEEINLQWEQEVSNSKSKAVGRRKKNDDQIKKDVEQYTNDIETLAERMTDAYRDDKDAIANGTLAINKLQLLNDVVAMLHRRNPAIDQQLDKDDIDRPIANENFLKACKKWLDPLPDGSLPNLKIRENIIKNLNKLEVDQVVLVNSKIGQAIMFLSKHKNETRENKKILQQLIAKWSRPIFDCQVSYSDLKQPNTPPQQRSLQRTNSNSQNVAIDDVIDKQKSLERRNLLLMYPKKASLEFNRRPKENVRIDDDDEDEKVSKRKLNEFSLEKQIQDKMAMIRKQNSAKEFRAFNVSYGRLPRLTDK